jgi:hypothetical protein
LDRDPSKIIADANSATRNEINVSRFGVIHRMSTTTQFSNMASGEVTKDDHHSSFLFFVSHNLINFPFVSLTRKAFR